MVRASTPRAVPRRDRSRLPHPAAPRGRLRLATLLCLLVGLALPVRAADFPRGAADRDGNGVEDLLDGWRTGRVSWPDLRAAAVPDAAARADRAPAWPAGAARPAGGAWERGEIRLLCLGRTAEQLAGAREAAQRARGSCRVLHSLRRFGGVSVLALDAVGLRAFLAAPGKGTVLLDRDGRPALDRSRRQAGAELARAGFWQLEGDWTSSVAILDSGCDTAHDDLGDFSTDNSDGPPPAVGDALDWFPAASGWPVFQGYRVVGWHDVTDDFPEAVGPWDYHYHGTALAGVVAGEGEIVPDLRGLGPASRLTIVKFYDFDGIWHQWAGDFLAACAWLLDNRTVCRVRVALVAVNWDVDAGLDAAMTDLADAGILPVVAVGNDGPGGWPLLHPAASPDVLTVGALNDDGAVAAYSSRGEPGQAKPDLLAPGGGLLPGGGRIACADNEPNDSYSDRHGTSLAAAHAAAGAALLLEAFRKEGFPAPGDRQAALMTAALLRSTAGIVKEAETAAGDREPLAPSPLPDAVRGWGALQVQAAVEAALQPLMPGASLTDSLGGADGRLSLGRRLPLLPGESCRIEVEPAPGLDVALELHEGLWLLDPLWGGTPVREDGGGPGATESASISGRRGGWTFLVVKRVAGRGIFTVRALGEEAGAARAYTRRLNGEIAGHANSGRFAGMEDPVLVLTSSADVDPFGRLIHALDSSGQQPAGWPVALFLPGNLQGPLSAPLLWDLDGTSGDEVVTGSAFGRVYYVTQAGAVTERTLAASNVPLSAPAGILGAAGGRRLLVAGGNGTLYRLAADASLLGSVPLGGAALLAPAVGQLTADGGEEAAVLAADGTLHVLDSEGQILSGWPVPLGSGILRPPVLADLDGDGRHEIVVALLPSSGSASVVFRVLEGDGSPSAQDGAAAAAPGAGVWLDISPPAVGGGPASPRVAVSGLVSNGASGSAEIWTLAEAGLPAGGPAESTPLPGLEIRAHAPGGILTLQRLLLAPPLAWDFHIGDGCETEAYVLCGWEEEISGFLNLLGAATCWYRPEAAASPLSGRVPRLPGGPAADLTGLGGGALYSTGEGVWWRVSYQRRDVAVQRAAGPWRSTAPWASARGDGRNSGAWPLPPAEPTGVAEGIPLPVPRLAVWPNPGAGALQVRWRGVAAGTARLAVYDLRGRRVRTLRVAAGGEGGLVWDTRDEGGRPVAAGHYLLVLEHPGGRLTGRVSVSR